MKIKVIQAAILTQRLHEETIKYMVIFSLDGRRKTWKPEIDYCAITNAQVVIGQAIRVVKAASGVAEALTVYVADRQALALFTGKDAPSTPDVRRLVGNLNALLAKTPTKVTFLFGGIKEVFGAAGCNADVWD